MGVEHKPTFCRICEPLCGMIATVEDGRLTALRPDKDHPLSAGFACQKGIAFTEVVNDHDRVTTPLRRRTGGGFEPVGWDEAMTDIAARLGAIHRAHGAGAIGWYFGNPGAFSYSYTLSLTTLMAGFGLGLIGGPGRGLHVFTAGSQDVNNRFVASQLLYGSPLALPVPDVLRTDLLVVIGANPVISHGSVLTVPRIRDRMHDIVKRGGRVLVIDPRKTETAAQFEWLGIVPDGDAYLLLSLLHVMFAQNLVDRHRLASQADGGAWLERLARPFSPEATESHTGIEPETVRSLAHDLARTERAAVYGRVGTSTGENGTLTTYLLDAVNVVAGNLDVPGGSMFGRWGLPGERWLNKAGGAMLRAVYSRKRSRIGGFPSVLGSEPAAVMAKEIITPGRGQVRALFVGAGNPVLSVPNGDELETALESLDLMVGIDLYVNETLAHCDYVLPATSMYERDDFPLPFQTLQPTPFRQATEAVIAPVGQARAEWEIIDDLAARMWRSTPGLAALAGMRKVLSLFGVRLTPRVLVDAVIRLADGGDRFGLRRGLSFSKLTGRHPHGSVLADNLRDGVLRDTVVYRGRRIRLRHDEIATEVDKLSRRSVPDGYPMRMIGMREARSENSWLHNSPLLMRGERMHQARIHVDDAAAAHIVDGDTVRIASPHGEIELAVVVTKDIVPGVVAVPHGWGHKGTAGWRVANDAGGANVNRLMSSDPSDIESLAGMARLTGVPVRIERAETEVVHAGRNPLP
ncbi:molybdopterin-containing oxidoreductase family protein [Mycolicibacterium celeriflavum]|uniref:Formate dehydrogenase n=1 Tax=Mycolicibacterium celeriflavum TaxID=1249101 RepID=A0A1X0BZL9_MYCCF|nr:molybdopterin-dependent oxidoreductase [Mycolicibacterium celeriflavum]MCV7236697.1 molybdopterin-dependent oxidoreductase [Mycolicibacterium celeriflavum]ORA49638.1 formate dehydrogenase [Mycolicibacterium celeriflavum]BBY44056.1 formate dehydrogenase [Mycolicibacterium celeriflavum]